MIIPERRSFSFSTSMLSIALINSLFSEFSFFAFCVRGRRCEKISVFERTPISVV